MSGRHQCCCIQFDGRWLPHAEAVRLPQLAERCPSDKHCRVLGPTRIVQTLTSTQTLCPAQVLQQRLAPETCNESHCVSGDVVLANVLFTSWLRYEGDADADMSLETPNILWVMLCCCCSTTGLC